METPLHLVLLALVGAVAGALNALAGGGTFVMLPALLVAGLDPRAANVTSTIGLFPGQLSSAWAGRAHLSGTGPLTGRWLVGISLGGGAAGAMLLLLTPGAVFARLAPWLVLFAVGVFAWGSFGPRRAERAGPRLGWRAVACIQLAISVYGGYFGGGIGFLMLAALGVAGLGIREAGATKNALAAAMNAAAVAVFAFSPSVRWVPVAVIMACGVLGGVGGAWLLARADERWIRLGVVAVGLALAFGLFVRAP